MHKNTQPNYPNCLYRNVVSTVNLGCELKLKQIALHARNAEYNPKRFAAVIMRIREPKTTALIFASGKMVVTVSTDTILLRFLLTLFPMSTFKIFFLSNNNLKITIHYYIEIINRVQNQKTSPD